MKRKIILIIILLIFPTTIAKAGRGCCSHHGGVAGCGSNGRQICNDGTYSPSCTCTPTIIKGCTDKEATNYNSKATYNDGSCKYKSITNTTNDTKQNSTKTENNTSSTSTKTNTTLKTTSETNNSETKEDNDDNSGFILTMIGSLLVIWLIGKRR